jgi:nitrogen fixation/metabolism regulation signal transduction histidine kinase
MKESQRETQKDVVQIKTKIFNGMTEDIAEIKRLIKDRRDSLSRRHSENRKLFYTLLVGVVVSTATVLTQFLLRII